jgi:hypothetical protein
MKFLRLTAVAALLFCAAACAQTSTTPPVSQDAEATFVGTKSQIMRLAIKAIQHRGWKLDQVNEKIGIVSFETPMSFGSWSGITANLIIEDVSPTAVRVTGTANKILEAVN